MFGVRVAPGQFVHRVTNEPRHACLPVFLINKHLREFSRSLQGFIRKTKRKNTTYLSCFQVKTRRKYLGNCTVSEIIISLAFKRKLLKIHFKYDATVISVVRHD